MPTLSTQSTRLLWLLFAVVTCALLFRFWTSLCFVPFADWNEVRLAPSFMLWHGPTPYPGLSTGPLTTWTYGPVPLILNLPALFAADAAGALLIGGVINLLCAIVPVWLALFTLSRSTTTETPSNAAAPTDRLWAFLLCLALWPNSSLQYIQCDNVAVAFGLLSCLALSGHAQRPRRLFLAAACVALAVWSKQTSLGLVPAQLLWLALTASWRTSLRYALVCAACGFALGGLFIAWFGFDGLWLNLVALPGRFPLAPDPLDRTRLLWMPLVGYVIVPVIILVFTRRSIFRLTSPWLLPVLVWLFLLPTALLSTYKNGGSSNSLTPILYLFPLTSLTAVAWLRRITPHAAPTWLTAGIAAVIIQQLSFSPLVPVEPMTTHLESGMELARKFRGHVYFPWNPLLTFYSEHKFYHVEDGLYTRDVSSAGRTREENLRDLPPVWSLTVLPGWRDYGIYKKLQPPDAKIGFFGKWTVYSWSPPPDPPAPK